MRIFTPCLFFQCVFTNFQCVLTLLRALSVALGGVCMPNIKSLHIHVTYGSKVIAKVNVYNRHDKNNMP